MYPFHGSYLFGEKKARNKDCLELIDWNGGKNGNPDAEN